MAARLGGRESERLNGRDSAIVMLEKQSVLSFRVPDLSQHQAYRIASLLAKTRVNKIQVKALSAATFKPPKGFSKLQHRPGSKGSAPPASPNAPEQTIQAIAPNLAAPRFRSLPTLTSAAGASPPGQVGDNGYPTTSAWMAAHTL